MIKKISLALLAFCFVSQTAWAYWIWTPESKKWTNPKYAPKESPQEQLKFAISYYEAKDYRVSMDELKKLIKYYADAVEAPEAQYYMGLCLEELGKYYEAYQALQKVIDKYPFSTRTDDVLQREYIVAQKLLDYRTQFIGISMTGENAAIEIFRKVIENAPYGKYAAASQYKIGLALKAKGYYQEATSEFQKVVDDYPDSEWADPAKFQIALCADKSSLDSAYDQTLTQEAQKKFDEFVGTHPDAELSTQAQERIDILRDKEAESQFKVGKFYEHEKSLESAKVYYQFVAKNYPKSPWAEKSLERLKAIERGE
jgi:outer membrane protein assembly factor BamD